MFKLTLELIRTIETTLPFIFQLWEEEFILVCVSGGGWCRAAGLAETITNSVKLKLELRLSLAKKELTKDKVKLNLRSNDTWSAKIDREL